MVLDRGAQLCFVDYSGETALERDGKSKELDFRRQFRAAMNSGLRKGFRWLPVTSSGEQSF